MFWPDYDRDMCYVALNVSCSNDLLLLNIFKLFISDFYTCVNTHTQKLLIWVLTQFLPWLPSKTNSGIIKYLFAHRTKLNKESIVTQNLITCVCLRKDKYLSIFKQSCSNIGTRSFVCKGPFQFKMSEWTQTVDFKCSVNAVSCDQSFR